MKRPKAKAVCKTWWECVCGKKAMPLIDDTRCKCNDIYEQAWFFMPEKTAELLAERKVQGWCPGGTKRLPVCEDCGGGGSKRRRFCQHCEKMVCGYCWNHIHQCEPSHTKSECHDIPAAKRASRRKGA